MTVHDFFDSAASYVISGALISFGFIVDHGSQIMIFLGVIVGLLRVIHDGVKTWRYVKNDGPS